VADGVAGGVVSQDPDVHLRRLADLPDEHQRALWGTQEFYRFQHRQRRPRRETDLFEGLR
jgi:hypothetical protein